MEASAKDSTNVQIAFERVMHEVYEISHQMRPQETGNKYINAGGKRVVIDDAISSSSENKSDSGPAVKLSGETAKKTKKGCC